MSRKRLTRRLAVSVTVTICIYVGADESFRHLAGALIEAIIRF